MSMEFKTFFNAHDCGRRSTLLLIDTLIIRPLLNFVSVGGFCIMSGSYFIKISHNWSQINELEILIHINSNLKGL